MSKISMCTDYSCPKRKTCYRFNAPVDHLYQSYLDFKYDNGCAHYWAESQAPKKQIRL